MEQIQALAFDKQVLVLFISIIVSLGLIYAVTKLILFFMDIMFEDFYEHLFLDKFRNTLYFIYLLLVPYILYLLTKNPSYVEWVIHSVG